MRYVTVRKFASESGYSEDAIRSKLRDGIWRLGEIWIKAPDGRILIDVEGYESWVEMGGEFGQSPNRVSKSRSCIAASGAARGLRSSPPPLI
ncbi:excisionase [Pseudomonas aeruginosa]|nr:excisionase [Pseudomonas aeruginosa]MCO2236527.1 excisionase [Pseudomonas aeruginosa]MCO2238614.1 excisionase [Pseudomonas aeruginosa]MCO2332859.1 excisionase [Pseudomonas aeruginosa]MCO2359385.1 excisionase [Pseudomonas aeruginosa]